MAGETTDWSAVTRRGSLGLGIGAFVATTAKADSQTPVRGAWAALDALAARTIADRLAPGVQISVMKQGELVYSNGFGLANLETATPVTPASIFRTGSVTKQFTAAAILRLAEEGRLSVDDKLQRFLPDFPRAAEIGLRQLLSHMSGLAANPNLAMPQATRLDYDRAAYLARARAAEPLFLFEPGTGWSYSNIGYNLLGIVIETASGLPYPEYMRSRLFAPAGLARTAVDNPDEIVPGRAAGYGPQPGAPTGYRNARYLSMTLPGAAGAIRSTTEDLCRWHAALLGGRVLRPASLASMLAPVRLANGELPTRPASRAPDAPRQTVEYGFGIRSGTEEGRRYAVHTGGINGFLSELKSYPAEGVTVACMINIDGGELGPDGPSGTALRAMIALGAAIALGR